MLYIYIMSCYNDNRSKELNKNVVSPANINGLKNTIEEIKSYKKIGKEHILFFNYQLLYGNNLSTNINIPYIKDNVVRDLVIINNPDDAERLANKHIKKHPILEPVLYNSIISTTVDTHWKEQRKDFQQAFSVDTELKKLIPISIKRAEYCVKLLWGLSNQTKNEVNINDFFLNETMAQLQLALFGFSNDFQEKTNNKIRNTFNGDNSEYAKKYFYDFLQELKDSSGPLTEVFNSRIPKDKKELFGNAIIFSYAGHDTTGNTLTWLIYEISKNQDIQYTLQTEIDLFWRWKKDRHIEYEDFKKLPFMTRCIMETLRLWSPIPNGTYRELIEDDYIIGIDDKSVFVPKGAYIQIPNWSRHINSLLWGKDANIFNPYREFKDDELWNNTIINSYNPSSKRFSPFTYGPRDCIGKNFSQIEMRIILLHLLKHYSFSLSEKQKDTYTQEDIGLNRFTLGPRDIYNYNKNGLYVKIKKRIFNSSL
jgi:cytochrome P450